MKSFHYLFIILSITLFTNCSDDDASEQIMSLESEIFNIATVGSSGVFGTIEYFKNSNSTITIEINLVGIAVSQSYPATIYFDTAVEFEQSTTMVALNLEPVDGNTGKSRTTFSTLENGTAITYEELLNFDGNVVINQSGTSTSVLAQSDIGQNIVTTNNINYALNGVDVTDISGVISFSERVNGEALAVITLTGSPAGGMHPAHIHVGSVATAPGAIMFSFTPVDGTMGISKSNIAKLDDGTPFGYTDILNVNGYVNVHLSSTNLGTLIAQGNIGIN